MDDLLLLSVRCYRQSVMSCSPAGRIPPLAGPNPAPSVEGMAGQAEDKVPGFSSVLQPEVFTNLTTHLSHSLPTVRKPDSQKL